MKHTEKTNHTGQMPQADRSLRWVHRSFCWFCHKAAQLLFFVGFYRHRILKFCIMYVLYLTISILGCQNIFSHRLNREINLGAVLNITCTSKILAFSTWSQQVNVCKIFCMITLYTPPQNIVSEGYSVFSMSIIPWFCNSEIPSTFKVLAV